MDLRFFFPPKQTVYENEGTGCWQRVLNDLKTSLGVFLGWGERTVTLIGAGLSEAHFK